MLNHKFKFMSIELLKIEKKKCTPVKYYYFDNQKNH